MSNNENDEKKRRQMELVRKMWLFLMPVFALIILFMLYNWSQGKGNLRSILSPLAMIFVGLATLSYAGNRTLYYILLALAVVFAFSGLITSIIY